MYAWPIASSASSPGLADGGLAHRLERLARSSPRLAARKSSFFVPKSRKTYGCEMPARRAMSSVDVPCSPRCGELVPRGLEDLLAALLGAHAGLDCHGR